MRNLQALSAEADRYSALAAELRQEYAELDDETLADTLEGLSDLPDILKQVIRSSLDDEVMAEALRSRLSDMRERLERIETRHDRKRALVSSTMTKAGLAKVIADDFSVSLRHGAPKLEITEERAISAAFLIMQPPRIDRAGLLAALKQGETVDGAVLQEGLSYVQVRTK
jgi:hypothetical protein